MKLLIKPFLAWLKKAIKITVKLQLNEGVVFLVLAVSLANKELFRETFRWVLKGKAVEVSEGEFDELEPSAVSLQGAHTFAHRSVGLMKRPKVRLAPAFIPVLSSDDAETERTLA